MHDPLFLSCKKKSSSLRDFLLIIRTMKPNATTRAILAAALVLILLINSSIEIASADRFCDSKCGARCSKAGRKDRCLKYCGICCDKCHCVPSGTYGNKDECPCYRDMKNSKGNPKCP